MEEPADDQDGSDEGSQSQRDGAESEGRSAAMEKKAIAAAKRIGRVEVDHGETGCKTPDAAAYIKKTAAHHRKKANRARI